MTSLPTRMTTERLVLRRFAPDDLQDLHRLHRDESSATYLSRGVRSLADVRLALARRLVPPAIERQGDGVVLAITALDGEEVIGEVSLWLRDEGSRAFEPGFALRPDARGRGYAYEAAARVLELAFDELGAGEVFGTADCRNAASVALLGRLGMVVRRPTVPDVDRVTLGITRVAWRNDRSPDARG